MGKNRLTFLTIVSNESRNSIHQNIVAAVTILDAIATWQLILRVIQIIDPNKSSRILRLLASNGAINMPNTRDKKSGDISVI